MIIKTNSYQLYAHPCHLNMQLSLCANIYAVY